MGIVPLSYGSPKNILGSWVKQLGRTGQSVSPVVNIVTKVQMSVGVEAVDCFASGSATTVACDLCDKNMLLVGLQYVGIYFTVFCLGI